MELIKFMNGKIKEWQKKSVDDQNMNQSRISD